MGIEEKINLDLEMIGSSIMIFKKRGFKITIRKSKLSKEILSKTKHFCN